jgi:hypothetical protein
LRKLYIIYFIRSLHFENDTTEVCKSLPEAAEEGKPVGEKGAGEALSRSIHTENTVGSSLYTETIGVGFFGYARGVYAGIE